MDDYWNVMALTSEIPRAHIGNFNGSAINGNGAAKNTHVSNGI